MLSFNFFNFSLLLLLLLFFFQYVCYGFERLVFTLRRFLLYTSCCCSSISSSVLAAVLFNLHRDCYAFKTAFLPKRFLSCNPSWSWINPQFIKVSLGANSSTLKISGKFCWVLNIVPAQPFFRITKYTPPNIYL